MAHRQVESIAHLVLVNASSLWSIFRVPRPKRAMTRHRNAKAILVCRSKNPKHLPPQAPVPGPFSVPSFNGEVVRSSLPFAFHGILPVNYHCALRESHKQHHFLFKKLMIAMHIFQYNKCLAYKCTVCLTGVRCDV